MGRKRSIQHFLVLTSLLILQAMTAGFAAARDSTNDFDIRISIYRSSDGIEHPLESAHVIFVPVVVPAAMGSLENLLLTFKFHPDSDAIALLYALNPNLEAGGTLHAGEKLLMIQVEPTVEITRALSDQFLFRIRFDEALINDLISSREPLRELAASATKLGFDRFSDPSLRKAALDCASDGYEVLDTLVDYLEERTQPLNHEMLSQVRGDVELLSQILTSMSHTTGVITAVQTNRICAVAKDLHIKQGGFQSTRGMPSQFSAWPRVRVRATTIDSATGKQVQMWTVHWAAEQLQDDPKQDHPLSVVTSPVEVVLPEADYVFWATKDGIASNRRAVSVRVTEDMKPLAVDIPISVRP